VLNINNYNGEWTGGVDVGFTFNMPFFEQSLNCGDCSQTSQEQAGTFKLQLQGKDYTHATSNSEFNIGVQPDTGFMQTMNKESTTVMLLSYFANSSQPMQAAPQQAFPLPELEPLIGQHVPIYDLKDALFANQDDYLQHLGYVADNQSKVRTITIWMIVLTCLCFIGGLVLTIVYRKNQANSDPERISEVRANEDQ